MQVVTALNHLNEDFMMNKNGKGFSEQPESVAKAGKKGSGKIQGNMKQDAGRSPESIQRSHGQRQPSGDHS